jgi:hypothetical protein
MANKPNNAKTVTFIVAVVGGLAFGAVPDEAFASDVPLKVGRPAADPLEQAAIRVLTEIANSTNPEGLDRVALARELEVAAGSRAGAKAAAEKLVADAVVSARRRGPAHGSPTQAQAIRGVARRFASNLQSGSVSVPVRAVPGGPGVVVPWRTLGGFAWSDGMTLPPEVSRLNGQKVTLMGNLMLLEEVNGELWYLLVESLWDCCFGQPPELHQAVVVRLGPGLKYTAEAVQLTGTLSVGEDKDAQGYVSSVYRLEARHLVLVDAP